MCTQQIDNLSGSLAGCVMISLTSVQMVNGKWKLVNENGEWQPVNVFLLCFR